MDFKIREEKPKIAVDVDGTLAKTTEAMLEKLRENGGGEYQLEDVDDWIKGVEKVFGNYEKYFELYNELWEKERERIKPHISKKELEELSKYYEVVIVSNRQDEKHKEFIKDWLKKNFGLEFKVVLVKDMVDKVNNGEYSVIIDDAPRLVEAMVNNNYKDKKLILVKRPWNKKVAEEIKHENIVYVDSTEEAIKLAIKLRNKEKTLNRIKLTNS